MKDANSLLKESNTRLARANDQLELHDRLQKEFINIAAHELRTPIMPILGATDLLESRFQQSKNGEILLKRDDFDLISRNARRLERLATDILDVTRIETQSLRLNRDRSDLYDVIELAVHDVKNQFPDNGVNYEIKLDKGIIVHADKSKISQVLSNLLNNATRFTDHGFITVTGGMESGNVEKEDNVHVSVSDTGIGIDSEIIPRLFTRFTNKPGTDRPQGGSGLGLYISKGIIEAHGGRIWAENNANGVGATFHFSFPVEHGPSLRTKST